MPKLSMQNEHSFTISMRKGGSCIQAQVRTAAWDTQLHRVLCRGNAERGIMYAFVTSRVTNHRDEGQFRNHRLYLMLLVRARLRASEVWDQNSGRFLLLSWVWHVSFRLFANEAGVQCVLRAERACALKCGEVIVTLVKAYLLWEPGSWAHTH